MMSVLGRKGYKHSIHKLRKPEELSVSSLEKWPQWEDGAESKYDSSASLTEKIIQGHTFGIEP
jgi:hypothetical protein